MRALRRGSAAAPDFTPEPASLLPQLRPEPLLDLQQSTSQGQSPAPIAYDLSGAKCAFDSPELGRSRAHEGGSPTLALAGSSTHRRPSCVSRPMTVMNERYQPLEQAAVRASRDESDAFSGLRSPDRAAKTGLSPTFAKTDPPRRRTLPPISTTSPSAVSLSLSPREQQERGRYSIPSAVFLGDDDPPLSPEFLHRGRRASSRLFELSQMRRGEADEVRRQQRVHGEVLRRIEQLRDDSEERHLVHEAATRHRRAQSVGGGRDIEERNRALAAQWRPTRDRVRGAGGDRSQRRQSVLDRKKAIDAAKLATAEAAVEASTKRQQRPVDCPLPDRPAAEQWAAMLVHARFAALMAGDQAPDGDGVFTVSSRAVFSLNGALRCDESLLPLVSDKSPFRDFFRDSTKEELQRALKAAYCIQAWWVTACRSRVILRRKARATVLVRAFLGAAEQLTRLRFREALRRLRMCIIKLQRRWRAHVVARDARREHCRRLVDVVLVAEIAAADAGVARIVEQREKLQVKVVAPSMRARRDVTEGALKENQDRLEEVVQRRLLLLALRPESKDRFTEALIGRREAIYAVDTLEFGARLRVRALEVEEARVAYVRRMRKLGLDTPFDPRSVAPPLRPRYSRLATTPEEVRRLLRKYAPMMGTHDHRRVALGARGEIPPPLVTGDDDLEVSHFLDEDDAGTPAHLRELRRAAGILSPKETSAVLPAVLGGPRRATRLSLAGPLDGSSSVSEGALSPIAVAARRIR